MRFSVKHVLRLGIILLGLRLNLQTIAVIGGSAIGLVLVAMTGAFVFAVVVGRRLGVRPRVAVLVGVGTSVCGNSAILAAAPVVSADEREDGLAVATITIFGTLAVFVFPLVGHALDLDVLAGPVGRHGGARHGADDRRRRRLLDRRPRRGDRRQARAQRPDGAAAAGDRLGLGRYGDDTACPRRRRGAAR